MRTAIYGGAFNPPHLAHAEIAKQILTQNLADRVILVPSGRRRDETSYPVTDEERLSMMQRFIEDIEDPRISVDGSFLPKEPADGSTTALHDHYVKNYDIVPVQVFGSDSMGNIPHWFEPERVAHEVPKIIIRRPGDATPLSHISNYQEMKIEFSPNTAHLSSTIIRDGIKQGNYSGLSPRVKEYIRANELYKN